MSEDSLSIARGVPLSAEPGLGAMTLPGYLKEVTERFAAREALVMHRADGSVVRWSYDELWERAMTVARALAACGVGKDSRVGVLMTNRPEWVASMFGVGLAGAVTVALSTFSTQPELEYLLHASGVSILLFERSVLKKDFGAMLHALEPEIGRAEPGLLSSTQFPYLRWLAVIDEGGGAGGAIEEWSQFLARGHATSSALIEARAAGVRPADPAAVFFSSGSTGKPKGILSAHRAVAIQCWRWARMFGLGDDVRTLTANGFFWSGNFGMALGGTLSCGGAMILQSTFDAEQALRLMEAERVTFPVAWPHQWAALEGAPNWATTDLSSLHYVDRTTAIGRHPTVKTTYTEPRAAYGNTETFTISTAFAHDTPPDRVANTHGEVLPGNTVKVVDPLTGALQPRGQPGEIAVKGATLMLGYIGVPIDETLDAAGFFATGDGGYMDAQGRLVWQGRLNDIIKTGGANVSPIEVDTELAGCPGVKHSVTVGVPHETLGELVVACVVTEDGRSLTEATVRDFLKERLASYKVPRRVLFVDETDLSLTGTAKVKTGALRELAAKRLATTA